MWPSVHLRVWLLTLSARMTSGWGIKMRKRQRHTEGAKAKMSISAPVKHAPKHNAAVSETLRGREFSAAHKKNISKGWIGRRRNGVSGETRAKMSVSHKGLKMPSSHRRKTGERTRKQWSLLSIEEKRKITRPGLLAARQSNPSSIETIVGTVLCALGVRFKAQHPIGRYIVDFLIPEKNLVVECDGDYWHSLPGRKENDIKRDAYLISKGFQICHLAEKSIIQNAESLVRRAVA